MTISEAKERLIRWAESQLGYKEGSNNWNKYAENEDLQRLYGWKPQNQPWCDTFVDSCFILAFGLQLASKLTYQPIGSGSALCRTSANYYQAHEAFYDMPQVGDQIFCYYDGAINHTGIVASVERDIVYTIEGNTSDMVARRSYYKSSPVIAGYGRPDWQAVVDEDPAEDPEPAPEDPPEEDKQEDLPCVVKLPMLQKGDTGHSVKALQGILDALGYDVGWWGADGDFGNDTDAALKKWQENNGLEADGICGPQSWRRLLLGG